MQKKKQDEAEQQDRAKIERYIVCQVCGRKIKPDMCSWLEDDGGMVCFDCREERESCGCSD